MEEKCETVIAKIKDTTSNPAPLGLLGFGLTTVLLNIHNTGYYTLSATILGMGIFYGGLAQVFAGWMEWKKGNTFGTVAFASYGLFWLSLVFLLIAPKTSWGADFANTAGFLGWYFILWGAFTFLMFIGTLRINRALQVVFGTLALLFLLLAIGNWADSSVVIKIAGWEGIITGLSAVYAAIAQIWNEVYDKVMLPIGPVQKRR